jgi:hypothetical protein
MQRDDLLIADQAIGAADLRTNRAQGVVWVVVDGRNGEVKIG